MSDILTMQSVLDAMNAVMKDLPKASRGIAGRAVITSDYLTVTEPRVLSRWERFRAWFEGACDKADLIYPWRRVVRERTSPSPNYLLLGEDMVLCHPTQVARLCEALKRLS